MKTKAKKTIKKGNKPFSKANVMKAMFRGTMK